MKIKFTNRSFALKKITLQVITKTFAFLFCTTVFGFSSNDIFSQSIKVYIEKDKTVTIDEVFEIIKEQTDYTFIYEENLFSKAKKVSLKKGDIEANKLLGLIISDDFIFNLNPDGTITIQEVSTKSLQQQITVSGVVKDQNGQPLPGVNIIEKGTNNGDLTDFDGKFTLDGLSKESVLVVSFIGFKTQEIQVNDQTQINIQLEEDTPQLNEVVVIGYGTTKKGDLTAAVDQVDGESLENRPNTSAVTSLQGLMPGLNIQSNNGDPRQNAEINVRGFNSINGGSPLVLIDGIEGNINLLNPSDIESVTVLKDAGSAAIYGARGAFGVILVTTKKGKEGKVKVNLNSTVAIATPTIRTDFISDPVKYGRIVDEAINGYNGSTYTGYTSEEDWERLQRVADGIVAPWKELQANGTFKFYDKTDWYDYLYKKSVFSFINDVSVSGGNETIQTYLSARSYKSGTVQKLQDEEVVRKNIKANVSVKVNDWLELSSDIRYNIGNQTEYGGRDRGWGLNWTYANNYLYAFQPAEIDGISYDNRGQSTHASVKAGRSFQNYDYKQLVNTFSAILTPIEDLVVNVDYSNRFTNTNFERRLNEFEYLTGDRATLTTAGLNRLTEEGIESVYNVFNVYGTYSKTISDYHNFKLTAGYNYENFEEEEVVAEQGGLIDPNYSNLNLGTEVLRADGASQTWALQGTFGRFHYDYDNKYLLDLTARYDGSSRFPKDSRYGFFPSGSVGWYVSKENFWRPLKDVVNSFKLRGSYGKLGNQNVGLYTFAQLLPVGTTNWLFDNSQVNYVGLPGPLPKAATWEKTGTTNVGLDLGFFGNRLTTSIDVFQKRVTDMYLPGEPLPGVFGANEPRENNADLEVKGFELTVAYQNNFTVANKPLNFKIRGNLSNSVGKITKYSNPNGLLSSFYEGQTLGEIWGYHVDGQFQSNEEAKAYENVFVNPASDLSQVYNFVMNVAQNQDYKGLKAGDLKFVDLNGDGKIDRGNNSLENHGDLKKIGNAMPKFPFGFSISSNWNGFDIMLQGAGVVSQDWYPQGRFFWGTYERPYVAFIRKDLADNAWSPDNPDGNFPQIGRSYTALSNNRQLSVVNDHFLTDIGYLRLKNATVGYTLPQDVTRKLNIDRVRLYFSGENLFTIRFGGLTKYLDPEQAGSGVSLSNPNYATRSSRVEDYPINKTFSFGVNISL